MPILGRFYNRVVTDLIITWRGPFENGEANRLHADAFETKRYSDAEWDWVALVENHSLGWVTARSEERLVGFANVISDGFVHAWLQDVMVCPRSQRSGVGKAVVDAAAQQAALAGCEWLHADFDENNAQFYYEGCGFQPTAAGLLPLT